VSVEGLAALTLRFCVALIPPELAVSVCAPAVVSVAENVPTPFVSVASGGRTTPEDVSLLVKWTVPAYAVSVFPNWSCAVTLNEKLVPAVGVLVLVVRMKRVALAAFTETLSVPVMLGFVASAAVIVCEPAVVSVAENVPWPFANVESAGRATPAAVSLLVKWIGPV